MLFSRDWLSDYVPLPDSADELARRLTSVGLAVEGLEASGDDVLLDVDVTTNRPDAMCHLGLAREVAVATGAALRPVRVEVRETAGPTAEAIRVTLEDPEGCPRYVARVVRGVRVGPSPGWLARRLEAIGLRPINNVVDVTNFVLWEMGQPLHAFDLAKIGGGEIRVRRARPGERLTTLDGEERRLQPEILVIADAATAVALAGVMGGEASEVGGATCDVLLESAHFDRRRVRVAARELGLHTDASHRFERGADPEGCRAAADRAAALIAELAGGEVLAGAVDARGVELEPRRGRLDLGALVAFAGVEIAAPDVERWLRGLGFVVAPAGEGIWEVTVPSFRRYDFEPRPGGGEIYPADLYEEVLRVHGYDGIPSALPAIAGPDAPRTPLQRLRDRVREVLTSAGLAEAINFAFLDAEADGRLPTLLAGGEPTRLANPLSERYAVLRRSLVPNLIDNARFNARRGAGAVRLFEIGHLFAAGADGGVVEREAVAVVYGGDVGTPWERTLRVDFFDLKGVVEELAAKGLAAGELAAEPTELPGVVRGTAALLAVGGRRIGWMGQVEDAEVGFDLFAAELLLDELPAAGGSLLVELPSRFPGIAADLTLTHAAEVPWAEIRAAVADHAPAELESFALKDRYQGPGVPAGAVNTTLSFLYGSPERSLTQEEVNERQAALATELERRFGWRGGEAVR